MEEECGMEWEIREYKDEDEKEWDVFVREKAVNGTFLQTRRFLNYHSLGKFKDNSLLFFRRGVLQAVCPACILLEGTEKTFYSHMGSTYGAIVFSDKVCRLELVIELLEKLEDYLQQHGFTKCIMKPTMKILCGKQDDCFNYALYQKEYKELNLHIDFEHYNNNIFSNLSATKRRQVKECMNKGMILKELAIEDLCDFYEILVDNLKKFQRKPVHTLEELVNLKSMRFPKEIKFWGAYIKGEMVAGTMVFEFEKVKCAHTQYLAAKSQCEVASPMSFIYYSMIQHYYKEQYKYLSWGIATEHYGQGINWGLMRNKEEFGSAHCYNSIYEKRIVER